MSHVEARGVSRSHVGASLGPGCRTGDSANSLTWQGWDLLGFDADSVWAKVSQEMSASRKEAKHTHFLLSESALWAKAKKGLILTLLSGPLSARSFCRGLPAIKYPLSSPCQLRGLPA